MRKTSKIAAVLLSVAAGAALCLSLAGCGGSDSAQGDFKLVEDGKLTIGSDLDYPPMEQLDEDGNPTGFGVAMMEEVCKRIGLECNYLPPQNFDSLISQVQSGTTMDVACSSITITDERAELVAFTDSYYDSNQAIVVKKGSVKDKSELNKAGVVVAAQSGTSGEAWIQENMPNATLKSFTATTDAMNALVAGQVSAVVYDQPIAETHVAGQFTSCEVLEVIATGEQYGIAVNKDNTALTEAINGAIAEMIEDGTMDKLYTEYLA